jgi:branched-chain amino acid transport system substrate-binding protein
MLLNIMAFPIFSLIRERIMINNVRQKNSLFKMMWLAIYGVGLCFGEMSLAADMPPVIKIGHAGPLTGVLAHVGKENENGVRLAIEEINATGGVLVNGVKYQLALVPEDDKADPAVAVEAAKRLVAAGVVGVIGHLNSGSSIAAKPVYAMASVAQISPASTNPKYTQEGQKSLGGFVTSFRVVANDTLQGKALVNYASAAMQIKRIALIDDGTDYGKGLADQVEQTARDQGVQVVGRLSVSWEDLDFEEVIKNLTKDKPEVVFFGGVDDTAAGIAIQMKAMGTSAKLMSGDGTCTGRFIEIAKEAADVLICSEAGAPLEKLPQGVAFAQKYKERFRMPMQIYGALAYDATYALVEAIKRANQNDRDSLLINMPSISYEGVSGLVKFQPDGERENAPISIYQVSNGKKLFLTTLQ